MDMEDREYQSLSSPVARLVVHGLHRAAYVDLLYAPGRAATAQEWQSGEVSPCSLREKDDTAAPSADIAMARMVGARLNSLGNKLAEAIIKQLHPTGVKATLRSVEMHLTPAATVAFITSEWRGGLTGNPYTTTVRWEFSTERHIGTFLVKDSAEIQFNLRLPRRMHWIRSLSRKFIRL